MESKRILPDKPRIVTAFGLPQQSDVIPKHEVERMRNYFKAPTVRAHEDSYRSRWRRTDGNPPPL